MERKTIFAVLTVAVLAVLAVVSTTAFVAKTTSLEASLLYYQPTPAEPGDILDIYLQLENTEGSPAEDVDVKVEDNHPFYVTSEAERVKHEGILPSQTKFLAKFKVRVAKDAHEGSNNLLVKYRYNGQGWREVYLPLTIVGEESALTILDSSTTPSTITPGSKAELDIRVKNIGSTEIRNLALTLGLDNLDVAPLNSSNKKVISQIKGGEERVFNFMLNSYPDITSGVYKLPVDMNYSDELGNKNQVSTSVGLVFGDTPDVSLVIDKAEVYQDDRTGSVILKAVNKGLSEVKFVNLVLEDSESYELLSSTREFYLGNIDSDDYETEEIPVRALEDSLRIPVNLTYLDSLNNEKTLNAELKTELLNKSKLDGDGYSNWVWALVAIVLLAGFWYYRKRKKEK